MENIIEGMKYCGRKARNLLRPSNLGAKNREFYQKTYVFASHTSNDNQIAMLTLAAALYGLTEAPVTGPALLPPWGIWVVFARARTAHHIDKKDTATAKPTEI
jgi:hypothetical protein